MSFEIPGLPKAAQQSDSRLIVYALSDGLFPVANPPTNEDGTFPDEGHPAAQVVREALNELAKLDADRRHVATDKTLSPYGREQKLASSMQSARLAREIARAELEKLERTVAAEEATVYSAPRLEPTDLAGALIDQEIRNYARSLKGQEAAKYAGAVLPKDPRHLAAIMRSPVPIPMMTEHAGNLWREYVQKNDPRAARVDRQKTALEWAQMVLPHVMKRLNPNPPKG